MKLKNNTLKTPESNVVDKKMDDIVNLCKNRGFIFAGSSIYGGLANSWDYGSLGVLLKNNIKKLWWKAFIDECPYNVGLDSAILMNSLVWKASGHVDGFSDPLIDCKSCKSRFRADKLIEEETGAVCTLPENEIFSYIKENNIKCPNCDSVDFTDIRKFNLMFKTSQGTIENNKNEIFLRPETAQGIFVNFKNVLRSTRRTLPFGIGQIGKSFRNEITPGNFLFRTCEFEQMELEFFSKKEDGDTWHEYWQEFCQNWLLNLGIKGENLRIRPHEKEELSHYSSATSDIEYLFPFGWGELWGIANRGNYDLTVHSEHSNEKLEYTDPKTGEKFIPNCIEPSVGVDRLFLAILVDAYKIESLENGENRIVLSLYNKIAPIKAAVLPLSKKLSNYAYSLYIKLCKVVNCEFDENGSIGKRYRRQDEIGTPFCITIDFDTPNDDAVTIRERDSMKQTRIKTENLENFLVKI